MILKVHMLSCYFSSVLTLKCLLENLHILLRTSFGGVVGKMCSQAADEIESAMSYAF